MAQNYAQYLAANNIFNHSKVPGYGENLYYSMSSAGITTLNGKDRIANITNFHRKSFRFGSH